MTKKGKLALLAKGEEHLARIEGYFEESLQEKDLTSARYWQGFYTGGLGMLEVLGLLSYEESAARDTAMFDRYINTVSPGIHARRDTTKSCPLKEETG